MFGILTQAADLARWSAVKPRLSVKFTLVIFLLVLMRMTKMMIIVTMTLMVMINMKMARMVIVHDEDFACNEVKLL